jgi:hypothetical protein
VESLQAARDPRLKATAFATAQDVLELQRGCRGGISVSVTSKKLLAGGCWMLSGMGGGFRWSEQEQVQSVCCLCLCCVEDVVAKMTESRLGASLRSRRGLLAETAALAGRWQSLAAGEVLRCEVASTSHKFRLRN